MSWTPERIAILTKMWADGSSASEIARSFGGVTRSAVIGKVHRLKLPKRPADVARMNIKRSRPPGPPRPPKVPKAPRLKIHVHPGNIVRSLESRTRDPGLKPEPSAPRTFPFARPWEERAYGQCAFPIGERGEIRSCCAPVANEGDTYCKACRDVMRNPIQPKRRDTNRLARWAA